jgi:hypothetical protein
MVPVSAQAPATAGYTGSVQAAQPMIDPSTTLGFQPPQRLPVDQGVAMGALNAHTDLMQIDGTLKQSLTVQQQMLGVLTQILGTFSPAALKDLTRSLTAKPPEPTKPVGPVQASKPPTKPVSAPRSRIDLQRQLVG